MLATLILDRTPRRISIPDDRRKLGIPPPVVDDRGRAPGAGWGLPASRLAEGRRPAIRFGEWTIEHISPAEEAIDVMALFAKASRSMGDDIGTSRVAQLLRGGFQSSLQIDVELLSSRNKIGVGKLAKGGQWSIVFKRDPITVLA